MRQIVLLCALLAALFARAETPQAGAQAIHALILAENYVELFTTRYSEWYKVEQQGMDPDRAIAQLTRGYQAQRELLLSVYAQLSEAQFALSQSAHPQTSENGSIATATVQLGDRHIPIKLYQMQNGLWGFHQ